MMLASLTKSPQDLIIAPQDNNPPPLVTFSCFPELPAELQEMIWYEALSAQGVVAVRPPSENEKNKLSTTHQSPDSLLQYGSCNAIRNTSIHARYCASKIHTSYVDGGNVFGKVGYDTLWLDYPEQNDFPLWDGPVVHQMAIPALKLHYTISSTFTGNIYVFGSIENILYGLYLRGTTDVSLVLDSSSGKIFKEPGITFRSPQYPGDQLNLEDRIPLRTLFFFRYLAQYVRYVDRDIDPLTSNFDDCANVMLRWINRELEVRSSLYVQTKDDGTVDFGLVSSQPCYDMYRDWVAGKWKLEHLRYVEATTFQRDATEREQKIGRYAVQSKP